MQLKRWLTRCALCPLWPAPLRVSCFDALRVRKHRRSAIIHRNAHPAIQPSVQTDHLANADNTMSEQFDRCADSPVIRAGYRVDPNDLASPASLIKGAARKRYARDVLTLERRSAVFPDLLRPGLEPRSVRGLAAIQPDLVIGEHLPDFLPGEIEIARMEIRGPVANLISFRVRAIEGERVVYRIVDDYDDVRPACLELVADPPRMLRKGALLNMCLSILMSTPHYSSTLESEFYPQLQQTLRWRSRSRMAADAESMDRSRDDEKWQATESSRAGQGTQGRKGFEEFVGWYFRATDEMKQAHQDRTAITELEAEEALAFLIDRNPGPGLLLLATTYDRPLTTAATRALLRLFNELPSPLPIRLTRRSLVSDLGLEVILWMFKGRERDLMLSLRDSPHAADRAVYRAFYDRAARAVGELENRHHYRGMWGGIAFTYRCRTEASLLHGPPDSGFVTN